MQRDLVRIVRRVVTGLKRDYRTVLIALKASSTPRFVRQHAACARERVPHVVVMVYVVMERTVMAHVVVKVAGLVLPVDKGRELGSVGSVRMWLLSIPPQALPSLAYSKCKSTTHGKPKVLRTARSEA